MNPDTQELFLLEFLVNHVNIPSVQAMQDDILQVKTCIEFRVRQPLPTKSLQTQLINLNPRS